MNIDHIIAPEIKNDELYGLIQSLAADEKLHHVLEIGSSSGGGSTEAFVSGLSRNPYKPKLYCMEVSQERFKVLKKTYEKYDFVQCYNCSSVPLSVFPSHEQVSAFLREEATPQRLIREEVVQGWLDQDIQYLNDHPAEQNGIRMIMEENQIEHFDMVLIDGSEFTGEPELDLVYGAKIILLDDSDTHKNFRSRQRLERDPNYELIRENPYLRNGYAAFRRKGTLLQDKSERLKINFFTIVLNGMPFIEHHIEVFNQLDCDWHWHIVEGVADLKHDTGWSVAAGGKVHDSIHHNGLSIDGSTEYLDQLKAQYPDRISIYRKENGAFWDGKKEMCNAPLKNIGEESLLWEVDADELWTSEQIEKVRELFLNDPDKTAAFFWCWFFVSPDKVISTRNCYGENMGGEWLRVWRFRPGMYWHKHEPPLLVEPIPGGNQVMDVGRKNPFNNDDTGNLNLVFQHFAYVTEAQLRFKELYYGYRAATERWRSLCEADEDSLLLSDYFDWVHDDTRVTACRNLGVEPLAQVDESGKWLFKTDCSSGKVRRLPENPVIVDGVFFQEYQTGIARVWKTLLEEWAKTDFGQTIIVLDRGGKSVPRIPNVNYVSFPLHQYNNMAYDRIMLQNVCDRLGARRFISTYCSFPEKTESVFMAHDMIPELFFADYRRNPMWVEKRQAIERAKGVICVSDNTKKDLLKFYGGIPDSSVIVAKNGVDRSFKPCSQQQIDAFKRKYGITRPYFLTVGNMDTYKNGKLFYEALSRMTMSYAFEVVALAPSSTVAGFRQLNPGVSIQCLRLPESEMAVAYSAAAALVFPSKYEGFGMPVLEAMSCACPVIVCPNGPMREVAGDAAIYVKDDDANAMADALCDVLKPRTRETLISRGLGRVTQFSWSDTASKIREVLEGGVGETHYSKEMAQQMMESGRYGEAICALKQLCEDEPNDPILLNDYAAAQFQMFKNNKSEDYLKQSILILRDVIRRWPSYPQAYQNLVAIYQFVGLNDKAEELMQQAISRLQPAKG